MLRELTKTDWQGILGIPPESVPVALILRGTRNLRRHFVAYQAWREEVVEIGSPNGIFEDVFLGRLGSLRIGYASVYGPAMASEIVHVFGVLGTRLVIQTGCCGAIMDGFQAGDLFVAPEAYCGDGASRYYLPEATTVHSNVDPNQIRSLAGAAGLTIHDGRIYTTAALLAEGSDDIDAWHQAGFAAVDMETATSFAVAQHFGMDRASILFGFDNPREKSHLLLTDAEKEARRAQANQAMIELTLAFIRARCGPG